VRFGRTVEDGFLPVYSVDTEEEAIQLLTAACPTNVQGDYLAPELVEEQTIDNLFAFGRRLEKMHKQMKKRKRHVKERT
jgi:hypothetical protein